MPDAPPKAETRRRFDLFASPLWCAELVEAGEINRALEKRIRELRAVRAGLSDQAPVESGQFEWVSATDFHLDDACRPLIRAIGDLAAHAMDEGGWSGRLRISECWANVSIPGGAHRAHSHPNSVFSGVYFVSTPVGAGGLVFHDPRQVNGVLKLDSAEDRPLNSRIARLDPSAGMLALFPSWLSHHVETNGAQAERISVAFNLLPEGGFGRPTARWVP